MMYTEERSLETGLSEYEATCISGSGADDVVQFLAPIGISFLIWACAQDEMERVYGHRNVTCWSQLKEVVKR